MAVYNMVLLFTYVYIFVPIVRRILRNELATPRNPRSSAYSTTLFARTLKTTKRLFAKIKFTIEREFATNNVGTPTYTRAPVYGNERETNHMSRQLISRSTM